MVYVGGDDHVRDGFSRQTGLHPELERHPLSWGEIATAALTPVIIAVFVFPQTDALWRAWRWFAWTFGCAVWAICQR